MEALLFKILGLDMNTRYKLKYTYYVGPSASLYYLADVTASDPKKALSSIWLALHNCLNMSSLYDLSNILLNRCNKKKKKKKKERDRERERKRD